MSPPQVHGARRGRPAAGQWRHQPLVLVKLGLRGGGAVRLGRGSQSSSDPGLQLLAVADPVRRRAERGRPAAAAAAALHPRLPGGHELRGPEPGQRGGAGRQDVRGGGAQHRHQLLPRSGHPADTRPLLIQAAAAGKVDHFMLIH